MNRPVKNAEKHRLREGKCTEIRTWKLEVLE